jgi:outer membrane lipoprotein-sorting protein
MKNAVKLLSLSLLILTGLSVSSAQAAPADPEAILEATTQNTLFPDDLTATVTLAQQDPEEGDETSVVRMFRRDADDYFLLLFERPETQLGQGYLNVADGLWFYDPESRQFTYTSLEESFGGSNARNSDFQASSLAEDYDAVSVEEGTLGNFDVWIMELEATNDEVTYPYRKIWVSKEPNLLLKSEDYSLTNRLLRTSYYPSYAKSGENYIADQSLFVDALVEGKQTEITLENISTAEIPNNVFTKAYMERVNR